MLALLLLSIITATNIGYFAQISDVHYDEYYLVGSPATCLGEEIGLGCCRDYDVPIEPYRTADVNGDANCDSPSNLIEDMFNFLATNYSDLDYVLWTGDSASHHIFSQSIRQNMRAVETVTDLLNQSMSNTQVYPSIGNHDTWPIDQLAPPYLNRTIVSQTLATLWGPWLNDYATSQLRYGGYYDTLVTKYLRLMSINTLYFEDINGLDRTPDAAHQWEWLESTLYEARTNKEYVWIIGHIFPSAPSSTKEYNKRFQQLVADYSDIVIGNFWGHTHKDQYILYKDENNNVVNQGYVMPSLVPNHWYSSLRVYQYDRETYEILNYYQFSADVSQDKIEPKFYYDAQTSYQMEDLSTESWKTLADEMVTNDDLFDKYYEHYYNGNPSNPPTQESKIEILNRIYIS